jgi:hypothetical protein
LQWFPFKAFQLIKIVKKSMISSPEKNQLGYFSIIFLVIFTLIEFHFFHSVTLARGYYRRVDFHGVKFF